MAKFVINEEYNDTKIIEADRFYTQGEFVDFVRDNGAVLFRIRADQVYTVERQS